MINVRKIMKKISFAIFALMASIAFTSCDKSYNDGLMPPMTSPEETPQTVAFGNGAVTSVATIDLATIEDDVVKVCNIIAPTVTDPAAELSSMTLTIGNEVININSDGEVAKADIANIVDELYGKRPVERELTGVVRAYYVNNGQSVVTVSDPITIKLIPEAPVIEAAYYLTGTINGWNNSDTTYKLTNDGSDPYENPVFTLRIPAPEGGDNVSFKMTPESGLGGDWSKCLAAGSGEGRFNYNNDGGDLVINGVEGADFYQLTFNMLDQTWSVTPITIASQYYLVGALQGWNSSKDNGMTCMMTPQSKTVLSFTTKWTGDHNLKIWSAEDFGEWGKCYGAMTDGDASISGTLTNDNSGAIVCPEGDAIYTITIDLKAGTYVWNKLDNQTPTTYEHISLIGAFNGWGDDFELEEVAPHNWYAEFTQAESGELKFRANHDWGINWGYGGDSEWDVTVKMNNIGANGAGNILVPAGKYDVYLNDITNSIIFVKK